MALARSRASGPPETPPGVAEVSRIEVTRVGRGARVCSAEPGSIDDVRLIEARGKAAADILTHVQVEADVQGTEQLEDGGALQARMKGLPGERLAEHECQRRQHLPLGGGLPG